MLGPYCPSKNGVDQLNGLDRSGFAIEFLRRNPHYRKEYARTMRRIARGLSDAETALTKLAHRWGLRFCARPGRSCWR